jgi:hypothetical protein
VLHLPKYFGNLSNFISHAIPKFQKTSVINRGNTTYISEQGKPPVITAGKLTADLLFNFENGAFSYFSFKDMKPEREVSKVSGGMLAGWLYTDMVSP